MLVVFDAARYLNDDEAIAEYMTAISGSVMIQRLLLLAGIK